MRAAIFLLATAAMAEYATVDGHKVYYEIAGRGEPAIVMVHGWTCDGTFWDAQKKALGAKHKLLIVDLPGHGRSDKPQVSYDASLFSKGVRAAMDAAGVKRAALMGHSMGAIVIRQMYEDAPDRVLALVSVDGSIFRNTPAERLTSLKAWAASMDGETGATARRKFIEGMFTESTTPALRKLIMRQMLAPPGYVAASAAEGVVSGTLWDAAEPVRVPTLVVDKAGKDAATRQVYKEEFANLDYSELDGVSHFLQMEAPDRFNPIVLEFLARLKR